MANVKVNLSGPLFDDAKRKGLLKAGIKAGTKSLLPRVEATVRLRMATGLKPPDESGRHKRSVTSRVYDSGTGVVKSTDTRPIKDWVENRRRRGVRLGKGTGAWKAGRSLAAKENKQGHYADEIARRLNGG